jgi:excinuclease ABC subunit B
MYADKITESMQQTIDETNRRRAKQVAYNQEHQIVPTTIRKTTEEIFKQTSVADIRGVTPVPYIENEELSIAADPVVELMSKPQLEKAIADTKKKMLQAARDMDFLEAARLRDEMYALEKVLKG